MCEGENLGCSRRRSERTSLVVGEDLSAGKKKQRITKDYKSARMQCLLWIKGSREENGKKDCEETGPQAGNIRAFHKSGGDRGEVRKREPDRWRRNRVSSDPLSYQRSSDEQTATQKGGKLKGRERCVVSWSA